MFRRSILFLLINFAALGIGGFFTGEGVLSDWYADLDKAPWTPPGWVFGFAWTTIMLCFSIYLALLWPNIENKKLFLGLFILQWILNVSWNPVFFYFHEIGSGLVIISVLTVLIGLFILSYWKFLLFRSFLLFPYFVWLLIATSLNAFIFLKN